MDEERRLSRLRVEVNAVVVAVEIIAVPVREDDLHEERAQVFIHVELLGELGPAHLRVALFARGGERLQIGFVVRVAALLLFQIAVNLRDEMSVVERAVGLLVKVGEKVLRERLLQQIQPVVLAVPFHKHVRASRSRHPGGAAHLAADIFVQQRRVLRSVVEMKFLHAEATLRAFVFVERHREPRLVIRPAKAARRALELHAHALEERLFARGIDHIHLALRIATVVLLYVLPLLRLERELQLHHRPREKSVCCFAILLLLRQRSLRRFGRFRRCGRRFRDCGLRSLRILREQHRLCGHSRRRDLLRR